MRYRSLQFARGGHEPVKHTRLASLRNTKSNKTSGTKQKKITKYVISASTKPGTVSLCLKVYHLLLHYAVRSILNIYQHIGGTYVNFYQTIRHNILDDSTHHSESQENFKSQILRTFWNKFCHTLCYTDLLISTSSTQRWKTHYCLFQTPDTVILILFGTASLYLITFANIN